MAALQITLTLAFALLLSGCGTFLSVREQASFEEFPGGVVVNQPAAYRVEYSFPSSSPLHGNQTRDGASETISEVRGSLVGVSRSRVMVVNMRRLPFASGTLGLKLHPDQTLKEVSLTSQTGAARAATAAQSGVDTRKTIGDMDANEGKQEPPPTPAE
jgi:hypothetical protein